MVSSLNDCFKDMRLHTAAARLENAPVLDEASVLIAQKQELETKKQLLDAFTKHFVVSEEEIVALTDISSPVDGEFFITLNRVRQVHADCQILLGTENQRLGLELMEQSSKDLNAGYQKLFRWVQREFKNLNLENPQINSMIRRALRSLAERPTLFQDCLLFFAEAREHILANSFYAALTGSSAESGQKPAMKPIEFYAHDPLRYVGDMLAWTHSTTVSEREALETLFISEGDEIKRGFEVGKEAEPWSSSEGEVFDGQKALDDLVNRNIAGVARALRQRVEQTLQNHEDAVLLYKLANLITFYTSTFTKLLGPSSNLLATLSALTDSSLQRFSSVVLETVSSLQSDIGSPPQDLHIPDFLDGALGQFSALLKSYDSSLVPESSRVSDFEPIVSRALDPFLLACEKMAKQLSEPGTSIFMTNCLLAARATLSRYEFVIPRSAELATQLSTLTQNLTQYQHAYFLHSSGLETMIHGLSSLSPSPSDKDILQVPSLPPFQPQTLAEASVALDDFLPSALMDALENLKDLASRDVARNVTADAAELFCEDFDFLEGILGRIDELRLGNGEDEEANNMHAENDEEGGVGEAQRLRDLFPRTSGEIRVLLS